MRRVETLEAVRWVGVPAGMARRARAGLLATAALAAIVAWAAWRPSAPVHPPPCTPEHCPSEPAIERIPPSETVAAAAALAVLSGDPPLDTSTLERARTWQPGWNEVAEGLLAEHPPDRQLAHQLGGCRVDDEACARAILSREAPTADEPLVYLAGRQWSQVRIVTTMADLGAAARRRDADRRAWEAARERYLAEAAASDRWHGPPWLRGSYAGGALLAWIALMVSLAWRSRRHVVELRAGTLQLDDLVVSLDQVAGVRAEAGRVHLLLHTGDELVSRPLGAFADEVAERVPISDGPVDPTERRAMERLVRAPRQRSGTRSMS